MKVIPKNELILMLQNENKEVVSLDSIEGIFEKYGDDYFKDYGLSVDLCNKFLAARSETMNGRLIVVHRIGSSNISV